MAIAALGALGSRLIPLASKGVGTLFHHIKEHHEEKEAEKAGLAPQMLNVRNAPDLLLHPMKATSTVNTLLKAGAASVLTPTGLMAKYMQLRQSAPKLLSQFAEQLKASPVPAEEGEELPETEGE